MVTTEESDFLVIEPDNSSVFSSSINKHLWFEVIEGQDAGIRVRIPLPPFKGDYPDAVAETLQTLEEGDVVTAVLQGESESGPWHPIELAFQHSVK